MGHVARAPLALVLGLLLFVGAAVMSPRVLPRASDPVYTPTQFGTANLRRHLQIGQTLRIRGALRPWLWPNSAIIAEAHGPSPFAVFVIYGSPPPIVSQLRRLPILGRLIPPTADHPLLNGVATYRVRAVPCQNAIPLCPWRSPALQLEDGGVP